MPTQTNKRCTACNATNPEFPRNHCRERNGALWKNGIYRRSCHQLCKQQTEDGGIWGSRCIGVFLRRGTNIATNGDALIARSPYARSKMRSERFFWNDRVRKKCRGRDARQALNALVTGSFVKNAIACGLRSSHGTAYFQWSATLAVGSASANRNPSVGGKGRFFRRQHCLCTKRSRSVWTQSARFS